MSEQWHPRAQTAATTRLTHEFYNRYRELVLEERLTGTAARPQSKARTRLTHERWERYRQLYIEERDRLAGLPTEKRFSVHPRHVHRRKKGAA